MKTPGVLFLLAAILATALPGSIRGQGTEAATSDRQILRELIPQPAACACGCSPAVEFFDTGNLWDYINGQADTYLQYGFQLLLVAECRAARDSSLVTVEIYAMESPLHAFGLYAAERTPEDNPIDVGAEGYGARYFLNFWKGPYYVKLLSPASPGDAAGILETLASAVGDRIKADTSGPELFSCFPVEDRVPRSERFVPRSFLGHSFLTHGYLADYRREETRYQLFLTESDSDKAAERAFDQYREFLESDEAEVSYRKGRTFRSMRTEAGGGKLIFQYRKFVGGVLGLDDFSRAEPMMMQVIQRLTERSGTDADPRTD